MTSPTKGEGDLPKGDITPLAYLVKWVTRGERPRGQKSQKMGDIIYRWPFCWIFGQIRNGTTTSKIIHMKENNRTT